MATKTETNLSELKINYLSESAYSTALANNEINENEIYMTPDAEGNQSEITVSTSGSGNAITEISAIGNAITATKGSTFLTAHPTISKSTDSTSTASPAHGGTFTAIDSITRDTNGHVTKVNTKTVTLPSVSSTDEKVKNTLGTTTKAYVTGTTSSTTNTGGLVFDTGVYLDTTAGQLTATKFKGALNGNADTATKVGTATVGSATQPVYISSGTPTKCTYTLGKSVPSNAVFTDTTYSDATTSKSGLMSSTDKTTLNNLNSKLGSINGITSDVNCEDSSIAASASMVNLLNSKLGTQVTMSLSGTTLTITTK